MPFDQHANQQKMEALKFLQELLKIPVSESTKNWYLARTWLLGFGIDYDIPKGIKLAKKSSHPDAIWFTNLFCQHMNKFLNPLENIDDVITILSTEMNDSRALMFTHFYTADDPVHDRSTEHFKKALKMENGLALALTCLRKNSNYKNAEKSALQDEPCGWYMLSSFLDKTPNASFMCLKRAAEMEYHDAQCDMKDYYNKQTADSLYWVGRLAVQGLSSMKNMLLDMAFKVVWTYEHSEYVSIDLYDSRKRTFSIGYILNSTILSATNLDIIDNDLKSITKDEIKLVSAQISVAMYKKWRMLTKDAVIAWCLFATKFTRLPKDVRLIISHIVWKSRREALYNIDSNGQIITKETNTRPIKRAKI